MLVAPNVSKSVGQDYSYSRVAKSGFIPNLKSPQEFPSLKEKVQAAALPVFQQSKKYLEEFPPLKVTGK